MIDPCAPAGPPRLAYCTNVVPAGSLDDLSAGLRGLWRDVADRVAPDGTLGLGLWFEEGVARQLAGDADRALELRETLAENRLELVTVNAFPARAFHAPVVKEAVYQPDWLDPARLDYTLNVARAVSRLVDPGAYVSLSTLPLGYPTLSRDDLRRAANTLRRAAGRLKEIEDETGVHLRIALEPEPCCALETTSHALSFFQEVLGEGRLVARHLGLCLDLCHMSVEHEDAVTQLEFLALAGIVISKVQVSAALEVPDPSDPEQRARLERFVEPRWLHQVGAGPSKMVLDLPQALADPDLADLRPWRVHFHVPLHMEEVGGLPTTRPDVERFLDHVKTLERPPVLELETYTWSVVPDASADLAANIAAEIVWVRDRLASP